MTKILLFLNLSYSFILWGKLFRDLIEGKLHYCCPVQKLVYHIFLSSEILFSDKIE